jgi:polysaccharide export outer membrane protein
LAAAGANESPAAGDHRIGVEDRLTITVFEAPELSGPVRVAPDGTISLPLLGRVEASGLTAPELQDRLEGRLRGSYMVMPFVSVDITEVRSQSIYVLGAVNKPGVYPQNGAEPLTFLRALALGEGLQPTASAGRAFIIRGGAAGERQEIGVDVEDVIAGRSVDPLLKPNDILYVPSSPVKSLARGVADGLIRMVSLGRIF